MDLKTIFTLIGLAAVVIVVLKFGRQLLTLAIVLAAIVVVAGIAWLVLQSGALDREMLGDVAAVARVLRPEPEPKAATPVAVYVCGGGVVTLALAALLLAGFFWIRWRLERAGYGQPRRLPRQNHRNSQQFEQFQFPVEIDGPVEVYGDDLVWDWGDEVW